MIKRPLCGMALAFLLGDLAAMYGVPPGLLAGSVFLCMAAAVIRAGCKKPAAPPGDRCLRHRKRRHVLSCIFLSAVMIFLGYGRYCADEIVRANYLPQLSDGMRLTAQGRLEEKQIRNDRWVYELSSCVIGLEKPVPCNRILVYSDSDFASIGETLVLEGTVSLWKCASNEGNFDARAYYLAQKIDFQMKEISVLGRYGRGSHWREGLWRLRSSVREVYRQTLAPEECGVLAAMALGDKELLDDATRSLYQAAGLSHIMAVSGLHISVVGMSLYRLLRKAGGGLRASGVVAGACTLAYGVMAGMGVSVQRAVLLFFVMLLGQMVGRSYDTLSALGAAALCLLWQNPYLPLDAGFRFSFAAVLGAVWVRVGSVPEGGRLAWLCGRLFPGISIQLATLPLVAWQYFELPVYAVPVNLLVLPMTGLLLSLGLLGGFAGIKCLPLARILLFPCQKLLELIRLLCGFFAALPGASYLTGRPKPERLLVYYGLLIAVTAFVRARDGRNRGDRRKAAGSRKAVRLALAYASFAALLLVPPARGALAAVLDVGQGDGIFLRTADGMTLFVDGGSTDVYQVGTYRILPFLKCQGEKGVDFWLVSHADEDHISGLREVLASGYPVGTLVFSKAVVRDDAYEELVSLAREKGTGLLWLGAGETLHVGEASLHALFPLEENTSGDRNASSLAVLYEEGAFTAFFAGDIGSGEEKELLELWKGTDALAKGIDLYKAAHHGSNFSNSEELLQALCPAVSVVSCGRENRYGHPGAEAIAHMEEAGSEVYYTMESGQITVTRKEGALMVQGCLSLGQGEGTGKK